MSAMHTWGDRDFQQFVPSTIGGDESALIVVSEARFHDEFSSIHDTEELESQTGAFSESARRKTSPLSRLMRWLKSPLCLLCTALAFLIICIVVSTTKPDRAVALKPIVDIGPSDSSPPSGPEEPPVFETTGSWAEAVQINIGEGIQEIGYVQDTAIHKDTLVASALDSDGQGTAFVFGTIGPTQWFPQGLLVPIDQQDPEPSDAFGMCVSIYEDMAIVGDPKTTVQGVTNAGTIYVFTRNEDGKWNEQTRLHPNTSQADAFFGSSCELDGTTLLVGAPTATGLGSAFVFDYNETSIDWVQTAELTPDPDSFNCTDSANAFRLGSYVSIKTGTAVVGPSSSSTCRRIYVFERQEDSSWTQIHQLGNDGTCDYRISVGESYLAIGDPCQMVDDVEGAGQVTMYKKNEQGWNVVQLLTTPKIFNNINFGVDVAVEENTVLVARPGDANDVGGAVLYHIPHHQRHQNKFELDATLASGFYGGESVALMGQEYAIVTSSLNRNYAVQEDSIHVFAKKTDLETDARPDTPSTGAPPQTEPSSPVVPEWTSRSSITLDDPVDSTSFGHRVAMSQNAIIASTTSNNVYVYSWSDESGWTGNDITPESAQSGSLFGSCLAIDGNWAIAGATQQDGESGLLYVFRRVTQNEWTLHSTLQPEDSNTGDSFGWDCDISGDTIAVSAPMADTENESNLGSVLIYVYRGSSWRFTTRITPSVQGDCVDGWNDYRFGNVVSLEGSTLAVAPDSDGVCRRVYVYERYGSLWPQRAELGENGDCPYAVSLDHDGTAVAIGDSCYSNGEIANMGQVQIYNRIEEQVWILQDTIQDDFPEEDGQLGAAVSLDGDSILIGRPGVSTESGGASVFTHTEKYGWENLTFLESGRDSGSQIALLGDTAIIGSPNDDGPSGAENMGSVRVYVYST